MNDRDCESCKKFSRNDPHESEGYCQAKRTWVDPQEGEDCKMHEFTLHSAIKYKDGTPIMSEPEKMCSVRRKTVKDMSNQLDYLERAFKGFAKTQDELIEEYDATLKTHGDTLEQHLEHIMDMDAVLATHAGKINSHTDTLEEHLDRICELENMYENVLEDLCVMKERLCKITFFITDSNKHAHIFENFCGNCAHAKMKNGIYTCELSGEIVDPDSASCSMFEPPF